MLKMLLELVVTGAAAGLLLLLLVGSTDLVADDRARRRSRVVLALLAGLAFFGVVVDMVHSAVRGTALAHPLGALEDAGEMLVVSLMLATVFRWADARQPAAIPGRLAPVATAVPAPR